jgi:hypothetical protein
MGGLFAAFLLLAGPGLVGVGAGLVAFSVLAAVGWVCVARGAIITGGYLGSAMSRRSWSTCRPASSASRSSSAGAESPALIEPRPSRGASAIA